MAKTARFWLMKTEPEVFSFEDLVKAPKRTTGWEGVRNYQARNFMRDDFQIGDRVFVYHSNAAEPGIAGTAKVVRTAYPDATALNPKSEYYDEKSESLGESRWVKVDVQADERFTSLVSLSAIRKQAGLADMLLIKRGMRLSIQPVTEAEWDIICKLGKPKSVR